MLNNLPEVGAEVVAPRGVRTVMLTTPGPSTSTMQAVPTPLMQEKTTIGGPTAFRTVPAMLKPDGTRNLWSVRTLILKPLNPSELRMFTAINKVPLGAAPMTKGLESRSLRKVHQSEICKRFQSIAHERARL
jgi:hypothetical protein